MFHSNYVLKMLLSDCNPSSQRVNAVAEVPEGELNQSSLALEKEFGANWFKLRELLVTRGTNRYDELPT